MNIANVVQGTPEWAAYRAKHFNASDAAAMLGCSPYKTRAQLLRELHTGVVPDVDTATHMRFQNGHRVEALARPLAEEFIGQELYPVVGSLGRLSASLDGLTLDESIAFEHKALNEELRACMLQQDGNGNDFLPLYHRVQMEQQQLVSGAQRTLFMASAWTAEGDLIEERHCWYTPDAALRQQIIDGWLQLEADLRSYVLPASAEPAPVGKAPDTLPALRIEVTGQVTASNLAEFKQTALAAIRSVNRTLATDQDFADAEKAVKWCSDVESRLKAAKEHALSQTADIDALFKTLDDIAAETRTVRLDLGKLVDRRKVEVKEEAVAKARRALDAHIAELNAELAPMRLPAIAADFAGCIKGLKSFSSMQDKLDGLLATTKIAAEVEARVIRKNVEHFREVAAHLEALFPDLGQLVHKTPADFRELVQARVLAQQERDRKAQEARQAAENQRIAAEAKRLADKQIEDARAAAAATAAPQIAPHAALVQAAAAPAAPAPAPRTDEPATLKLGDINARLAPLKLDAAGMAELGINPARTEGAAKLYREDDFSRLLRGIAKHIASLQAVPA